MQVKDCDIGDDFSVVNKNENIFDVSQRFTDIKSVVVLDNDKPVGIITTMDLVRRVLMARKDPEKTTAGEIMSSPVLTVKLTDDLRTVSGIMTKNGYMAVPVVDDEGKFSGALTIYDVVSKLKENQKK